MCALKGLLIMCRDWRKGALLYVFLEHFQTNVLRSGSRESQEVRKMQTLLCTAEPLAVSEEEVEFCFLSTSAVV